MARLVIPLVLVIAVGALAYVLLGDGGPGDAGSIEREEYEDWTPPELRGTGRLPDGETGRDGKEGAEAPATPPADGAGDGETFVVRGRVVADESGEGLAEVFVWCAPHREPCPGPARSTPGGPDPWGTVRSAEDGTFEARMPKSLGDAAPVTEQVDVFAYRSGRVATVACKVTREQTIEIRLRKGLALRGRVVDPRGRPIEHAQVRAVPGPETPDAFGHVTVFETPQTDEEGRFVLEGLLPGEVMIQVDHPRFMPLESGPYDPKDGPDLTLSLAPALRLELVLHTDDGRVPTHPALVWEPDPPQDQPQAVLLRMRDDEERLRLGKGIRCEPVRLPASVKTLTLRVKADEYAIATIPPFRPPSDGGEESVEVTLTGDLGTGSIRIEFEDDEAQPVSALQADVKTRLITLDPDAKPGGAFVVQPGMDLTITSLPAGSYRVMLFSKRFAPLETDVAVTAGQEAVRKLRVSPPAKVRVRFLADRATLVRFRLLQDGREAVVFPETGAPVTDPDTGAPILAAGEDGLVLTGLAAGTYTVEVISEELTAPATIVHLREGDTTDVEIHVSRR